LAKSAQPRKTHKVRRVLLIGGAIGGVAALAMSPVGAKVKEMIAGKRQEIEEPQSITLPVQQSPTSATAPASTTETSSDGAAAKGQQGNGVLAGRPATTPQGEEPAKGS
jgi:hypothetical protein